MNKTPVVNNQTLHTWTKNRTMKEIQVQLYKNQESGFVNCVHTLQTKGMIYNLWTQI